MAVRDPLFWKRFSMAVHMDEETGKAKTFDSGSINEQDGWLARQQAKKKRRSVICWAFWFCFLVFVAGVVAVIIWLVHNGTLNTGNSANPNGGHMGD
ncbi:Hypothetical protein R9X50_00370500 [Acrodontium crateriforme]|uniref:Uncharacterized protein n=1 Tax=Acrodontium crateriforme TaxID=150365 RepID=A0AAQ3M3F8_9PEZI|nr:Hypothetical protein R9X50_00370500 [Acrodontium crateriforme]